MSNRIRINVYELAYDANYPIINLDESLKQLIGQVKKVFIDSKGVIYEGYQYERKDVIDIYMITEALTRRREVFIKHNHNAKTYAEVIAYIAVVCSCCRANASKLNLNRIFNIMMKFLLKTDLKSEKRNKF